MKAYILTSMFPNGFTPAFADALRGLMARMERKASFVFVASEFETIHKKTDRYFHVFLDMFAASGIDFPQACVVDGRMSKKAAQERVADADVVWLVGGDTTVQYGYLQAYGLVQVLRERDGLTIGMSAGAINMAGTAICTVTCEHDAQQIYEGLGLVDISVEPHFDCDNVSDELLQLSETHPIYGLCDDGFILCGETGTTFTGDIFLLDKGEVRQISWA